VHGQGEELPYLPVKLLVAHGADELGNFGHALKGGLSTGITVSHLQAVVP
jgi:hypothetical protein